MTFSTWSNMRIGKKLALGFAAVLVVFAIAIVVTLAIGRAEIDSANMVADKLTPAQLAARSLSGSFAYADDAGAYYLMDRDDASSRTWMDRYNKYAADVDAKLQQIQSAADTAERKSALADISSFWVKYKSDNQHAFDLRHARQFEKAQADYMSSSYDQLVAAVDRFDKSLQAQIDEETAHGNALELASSLVGTILGLIAILFGILMSVLITRSIVRPLSTAVEISEAIAQGDLSREIHATSTDETGKLLEAMSHMQQRLKGLVAQMNDLVRSANDGNFNVSVDNRGMSGFQLEIGNGLNALMKTVESGLQGVVGVLGALANRDLTRTMDGEYRGTFRQLKDDANATVASLRELIVQIREAVETVYTAAREIAAGNTNLSQRTEEQASSLEETASSMEELTSTVKQNDENARQANQLAIKASDIAVKGGTAVRDVVHTMASINDSSKKIVDIISVIDGIAFQTNILALNAAVEAARAGEQGRGFAVVAGEVRNLAQRSANAAKEIKSLINDSVEKTGTGSRLVDSAGETIGEVVDSVKRVTDIMSEIAAASREQLSGIEQVSTAVVQMDQVTQQNAALVEEAAAAAASLEEQASKLVDAISVFTVAHGANERAFAKPNGSRPAPHAPRYAPALVATGRNGKNSNHPNDDEEWETF